MVMNMIRYIASVSSRNTMTPILGNAIVIISVILGSSTPAKGGNGDYLEISLPKTVYESYEPIIVNITLHMDPPFEWKHGDPAAAIKQHRRLHRPLNAVLKRDGEKVATVDLAGGSFEITKSPQHEVRLSAFGCVGNQTGRESISKSGDRRSEYIFFGEPGDYTIEVKGKYGGVHSNEERLEIVPPKDEAAAEAFASGGVDALAILMLTKHGEDAVDTFKKIASNSPDSVYGAYAGISLALREAEKPYWARTSARVTSEEAEQLANSLIKHSKQFPTGHPLYNRAMLRAANYRFRSRGQAGRARQTLQHLVETSNDSGTIYEASRILEQGEKIQPNEK